MTGVKICTLFSQIWRSLSDLALGKIESVVKADFYLVQFGERAEFCDRSLSFEIQVYVPQDTSVPQNASRIYFQYKIWKKRAKYFILMNIY